MDDEECFELLDKLQSYAVSYGNDFPKPFGEMTIGELSADILTSLTDERPEGWRERYYLLGHRLVSEVE